jgi:HEAT repeat protein
MASPQSTHTASLQQQVNAIISDLKNSDGHNERTKHRERIYSLGAQTAPFLIRFLKDENDFLRWDVISFLGEFAHPDTLEDAVNFALSEKEVHARWRSFWAVTRYDKTKVTTLLLQALKSNKKDKRWNAALILNMLNRKEALPEILEGLKSESNWVIWEALSALKSYGMEGTEDAVGKFISEEYPRDLRQEAALALGKIGTLKAVNFLAKALNDSSHHVRWRASFSLGLTHHPYDALLILKNRLKTEHHQEVQEQLKKDIQELKLKKNGSQK